MHKVVIQLTELQQNFLREQISVSLINHSK